MTLPAFKDNLDNSLGCDIYVKLNGSRPMMSNHKSLKHTLFVALRLLRAHKCRIALLSFVGIDDLLQLLVVTLGLFEGATRLHTLELESSWQPLGDSVGSMDQIVQNTHTRELFHLYFPDFADFDPGQSVHFPHLSRFCYSTPHLEQLDLKRTQLIFSLLDHHPHLVDIELGVEIHPLPWNRLIDVILRCPRLVRLSISAGDLVGHPLGMFPAKVITTKIEEATFRLKASSLFSLFRAIKLPLLTNLRLAVFQDRVDVPEAHFTLEKSDRVAIQQLNTLTYATSSIWGDALLSRLAAFHVGNLSFNILLHRSPLVPPGPNMLSTYRRDPTTFLAIGSPERIRFDSYHNAEVVIDALKQIDLAKTKYINVNGVFFQERENETSTNRHLPPRKLPATSLQGIKIEWIYHPTSDNLFRILELFHAPLLREATAHHKSDVRPDVVLAYPEASEIHSLANPKPERFAFEIRLRFRQKHYSRDGVSLIELEFLDHPLLVGLRRLDVNITISHKCTDSIEGMVPFFRALSGASDKEMPGTIRLRVLEVLTVAVRFSSTPRSKFKRILKTLDEELHGLRLSRPACDISLAFPES
jgi:hypothetical protein